MLLLSSCVASHLSTGIEPSFIWQSSLISNNVSSLRLPWLKSLATSNPRSWCSRAGFLLKNPNMKVPRHKGTTHDYTSYTQQQRLNIMVFWEWISTQHISKCECVILLRAQFKYMYAFACKDYYGSVFTSAFLVNYGELMISKGSKGQFLAGNFSIWIFDHNSQGWFNQIQCPFYIVSAQHWPSQRASVVWRLSSKNWNQPSSQFLWRSQIWSDWIWIAKWIRNMVNLPSGNLT